MTHDLFEVYSVYLPNEEPIRLAARPIRYRSSQPSIPAASSSSSSSSSSKQKSSSEDPVDIFKEKLLMNLESDHRSLGVSNSMNELADAFSRLRLAAPKPAYRWDERMRRITKYLEYKSKSEKRSKRMRTRLEISTDPMAGCRSCNGDLRLQKLLLLLDSFQEEAVAKRLVRTNEQRLFHNWFTQAILPHIYKQEWEANSVRALHHVSRLMHLPAGKYLKKVHSEVLVITPRRFGKTVSTAAFVAAVVATVPGISVAVFSINQRVSDWFMEKVVKFVYDIPDAPRRMVVQNREHLFLSETPLSAGASINSHEAKVRISEPGTSKFYAFPSVVDGIFLFLFLFFLFSFFFSFFYYYISSSLQVHSHRLGFSIIHGYDTKQHPGYYH